MMLTPVLDTLATGACVMWWVGARICVVQTVWRWPPARRQACRRELNLTLAVLLPQFLPPCLANLQLGRARAHGHCPSRRIYHALTLVSVWFPFLPR